jgi:hypothetical protein
MNVADNRPPLRAILFGKNFIALDDPSAMGMSAQGPGCLQTLAAHLLRQGYDPSCQLILHRAGQMIGKISVGEAARGDHHG